MTSTFEKTYGKYKVRGDYEIDENGAVNITSYECLIPCPSEIRNKALADLVKEHEEEQKKEDERVKDAVFPRELYHKTREWTEEKHGIKLRSIEFSL